MRSLPQSARAGLGLVWVAILLGSWPFGCAAPPPEPTRPVVLIGVDGLEWRVVLELVEQGRMPVIAGLMREGAFGLARTLKRTLSPVIWTSVATGKRPEKHGILGFTTPGPGHRRLYRSSDRRTRAIWNIATEAGRRVDCIGWWVTFPAEPIHGTMVAQTNTRGQIRRAVPRPWKGTVLQGVDGQVTPVEEQNRVFDIARAVDEEVPHLTRRVFGEIPASVSKRSLQAWQQSLWSFRADATYLRIAQAQLASPRPRPDLLMVYFGSPDVLGHRFWRHAYPSEYASPPSARETSALGPLLFDDYAWVDAAIGALLEARGGDPTVIIVSDHGMRAVHTGRAEWETTGSPGHHPRGQPGVLIVSGGEARRPPDVGTALPTRPQDLPTLGSVLDVTPTILALLGEPIGQDMDGAVLDVLDPAFLERHPVSFVPSHDVEGWRQGRPSQGLPGDAEKERLEQLRQLGYID